MQLDTCTGKDDLLRLAEKKCILPEAASPAPAQAEAATSVQQAVKQEASAAIASQEVQQPSRVKQMAMAANQSGAEASSPKVLVYTIGSIAEEYGVLFREARSLRVQ